MWPDSARSQVTYVQESAKPTSGSSRHGCNRTVFLAKVVLLRGCTRVNRALHCEHPLGVAGLGLGLLDFELAKQVEVRESRTERKKEMLGCTCAGVRGRGIP